MGEKLNGSDRSRYSDEELEEFKILILEKLEKANEDLGLLLEARDGNPNAGDGDFHSFKCLEEGQTVLSKEENGRLASRQQKFINNLENALLRIENKTYGICRVTGKLISKERLKSVPHTTLSIEAKLCQS